MNTSNHPSGAAARALEFLRTRTNYEQVDRRGATLDLSPIRTLLERAGACDRMLQFVHVAGTKGKGSTTWFVDALLRRAGVKTGRYISPHLQRLEERVAVNGTPVFADELGEAILQMAPFADSARATFFDILTAAAIVCFARHGVEIVVFETGLGGRLDSTNGVETKISTAITSLGLEHTEILGDTLEAIAREKAGIARANVPLFSVTNPESAAGRAIAEVAAAAGAPVRTLGTDTTNGDFNIRDVRADGTGLRADIEAGGRKYTNIRLPGRAHYQVLNLALAVAIVDDLGARGLVPGVREAISGAGADGGDLVVPGRFEIVNSTPPIVLDGAHTQESLQLFLESLEAAFPQRPRIVIFGASKDKNAARLFSALRGRVDLCILTKTASPRAADPADLERDAAEAGIPFATAATPADALALARSNARGGVVAATGSLYLVGEIRTELHLP